MDLESTRSSEHELLAEPLTDAEVRLVLERLSFEEYECPGATVGAVVEATGASPVTIARIVGAMRKTAFEERFNETFLVHEGRLDELEEKTGRLYPRVRRVEDRSTPPVLAHRQPKERTTTDLICWVFLALMLVSGITSPLWQGSGAPRDGHNVVTAPPQFTTSYTNEAGDKVTLDDRFEVTISRMDGSNRAPTEAEKAEALTILGSSIAKRQSR